ncbi:MAG: hypothetical protein ACR2NR_13165 [Solirubrobacteraceae bacterium]
MSASVRLAYRAWGRIAGGSARSNGDLGSGTAGGSSGATWRATSPNGRGGTPKWTSSATPSGIVTASRSSVEIVCPVARRMVSPTSSPIADWTST